MLIQRACMVYYDDAGKQIEITGEPPDIITDVLSEETDIYDILSDEQRENLVKAIYKICVIYSLPIPEETNEI
jgi:hypothetical protein